MGEVKISSVCHLSSLLDPACPLSAVCRLLSLLWWCVVCGGDHVAYQPPPPPSPRRRRRRRLPSRWCCWHALLDTSLDQVRVGHDKVVCGCLHRRRRRRHAHVNRDELSMQTVVRNVLHVMCGDVVTGTVG